MSIEELGRQLAAAVRHRTQLEREISIAQSRINTLAAEIANVRDEMIRGYETRALRVVRPAPCIGEVPDCDETRPHVHTSGGHTVTVMRP